MKPHHLAVSCKDWDRTRAFFIDFLGFKVLSEIDRYDTPELGVVTGLPGAECRWALLELGGYRVELLRWLKPEGRTFNAKQSDIGIAHLCFQVSDARETYRRVLAAGYEALSEVQAMRGGKVCTFYCKGPDRITVEFLEFVNQ